MNELALCVRPALPREDFCKSRPTFQFPKSMLQPVLRPIVRMQDAGILPCVPLQQHVVICGFPRSGTTLCQLMIESCVTGIKAFGRERRGLEVARFGRRTHSMVVTKRPKDVFLIDEIREFYKEHPAKVRFILLTRDPRAVLTSVHFSKPSEYFVTPGQWRDIYRHWKWACKSTDVLSIRYEDLVGQPDEIQRQIEDLTGWSIAHPFRSFHEHVPRGFDGRALNGLRELDSQNLHRWRQDAHRARIQSLLSEMPELPEVLIELGYETDDAWRSEYVSCPHLPVVDVRAS